MYLYIQIYILIMILILQYIKVFCSVDEEKPLFIFVYEEMIMMAKYSFMHLFFKQSYTVF